VVCILFVRHKRTTRRTSTKTLPVVSLGDSLPLLLRVSKRSLTAHTAQSPSSASLQDTALTIFADVKVSCHKTTPEFETQQQLRDFWSDGSKQMKQVSMAGRLGRLGSDGGRLRSPTAAQHTGTINNWYAETCTYANERHH